MYTLGTAAKAAGVSKSTIHRAIKRGTISARSKGDAGYEIDPAELHRVFPVARVPENASNGSGNGAAERYATPERNAGTPPVPQDLELEIRLAKAEAQLQALREVLEVERKRADELRQERDRWASALEASQIQITDLSKSVGGINRRFFGWFRRA